MVIIELNPLGVLLLLVLLWGTSVSSLISRIIMCILLFSSDSLMFRKEVICVCFYALTRVSSFIRMSGRPHSIILCIIIDNLVRVGVRLVNHGEVRLVLEGPARRIV